MSALPPHFLARKGRQLRPVRLQDMVTLIHNIKVGAGHKDVGFEDALETYQSLMKKLNHKVLVDPGILESALWSCNLLNEQNLFWDCRDQTFDEFVRRVLGTEGFNRFYNLIETKGKG